MIVKVAVDEASAEQPQLEACGVSIDEDDSWWGNWTAAGLSQPALSFLTAAGLAEFADASDLPVLHHSFMLHDGEAHSGRSVEDPLCVIAENSGKWIREKRGSDGEAMFAIDAGRVGQERNFFDPLNRSFPALGQMLAGEPGHRCTAEQALQQQVMQE
eukprot:s598_g16.t1